MRRIRMVAALALAAAVGLTACSLFGGKADAFASMRSWVADHVVDEQRRDGMLVEIAQLEADLAAFVATVDAGADELRELNCDYGASREQFDRLLAKHGGARRAGRDRMLATAFRLREITTADEWRKLVDLEIQAFDQRVVAVDPLTHAKAQEEEGR